MMQVVIALVKSRADLLEELLDSVVPTMASLISSERSETVKGTFLSCLNTVSRAVSKIEKGCSGGLTASFRATIQDVLETICNFAMGTGRMNSEKSSTADSLFKLLSGLGNTIGWELFNGKMKVLFPSLEYVLKNDGATAAAKVRCLQFLQQMLSSSSSLSGTSELLPLVVKTVPQGWNVSRAALEASGELAKYLQGSEASQLYNLVHEKVSFTPSICVSLFECCVCSSCVMPLMATSSMLQLLQWGECWWLRALQMLAARIG